MINSGNIFTVNMRLPQGLLYMCQVLCVKMCKTENVAFAHIEKIYFLTCFFFATFSDLSITSTIKISKYLKYEKDHESN